MLAKLTRRLHSRGNAARLEAPALKGIALLPSEILGDEIFPLVVDLLSSTTVWHRTLLALAKVCKRWRSIVHSTPLLWDRRVSITTYRFSALGYFRRNRMAEKYFEAVRMWVARSAPYPLSISLDCCFDEAVQGVAKDLERGLDILSTAAARLKSLHINAFGVDNAGVVLLRALERLPSGTLHGLTEVHLIFQGDVTSRRTIPFSFAGSEHLRRAKLNVGPRPLDLLSIPWGQLTHLDLTAPPSVCVAVVAQCSNLTSAALHPMDSPLPDNSTGTTTTLTQLTSLRITVSPSLIEAIGDNLVLPALTTLELYHDFGPWPDLGRVLPKLPLGSIQRLTLEFAHDLHSPERMCALFQLTHSVTELSLKGHVWINNAFLDALRADGPRPKLLLPQLSILSVQCRRQLGVDFGVENWQGLIACRVGAGLTHLVYDVTGYSSESDKGFMPGLAASCVDGLKVDMIFHEIHNQNLTERLYKYSTFAYIAAGGDAYLSFSKETTSNRSWTRPAQEV
ncbi:hypothetical protein C8R46DRAFT_1293605 [Mycena filopes]|nr:hypothetical protein C8R46DRAFT_1293605 [Mycena filopes]